MAWRTFEVFNARVMRARLRSEAEAEDVAIIGTVSDEERTVGQVTQTSFGVVETQRTPVPAAL